MGCDLTLNLCHCVIVLRPQDVCHNIVRHKIEPPIVTNLHAFEDRMHMQVRTRLYAQGVGITAFTSSQAGQSAQTCTNACNVLGMRVHMSRTRARHKSAHMPDMRVHMS